MVRWKFIKRSVLAAFKSRAWKLHTKTRCCAVEGDKLCGFRFTHKAFATRRQMKRWKPNWQPMKATAHISASSPVDLACEKINNFHSRLIEGSDFSFSVHERLRLRADKQGQFSYQMRSQRSNSARRSGSAVRHESDSLGNITTHKMSPWRKRWLVKQPAMVKKKLSPRWFIMNRGKKRDKTSARKKSCWWNFFRFY